MERNIRWFQQQGITEVLLACNTASSNALDYLHKHFPAMKIDGNHRCDGQSDSMMRNCVGVLATTATIASHVYKEKIRHRLNARVIEQAAPDLVALIENLADEKVLSNIFK
jgi:glutamate racemase